MTRRTQLGVVAAVFTAVDLAQKAGSPVYEHARSPAYVALAALIAGALVAFVPRVPSRSLSVAGGVAAAGALGNCVSPLLWGGVPNPIVAGGLAFNVADVCAVIGAAWLVLGAAVYGLRHPELLREPV